MSPYLTSRSRGAEPLVTRDSAASGCRLRSTLQPENRMAHFSFSRGLPTPILKCDVSSTEIEAIYDDDDDGSGP